MKLKDSTLIGAGSWLYFIVAIVLYIYLNVSWVKTFDFLFGVALLFGLSAWYVVDRIKYPDPSQRKSRWAITSYGWPYRRDVKECPPHNPQE